MDIALVREQRANREMVRRTEVERMVVAILRASGAAMILTSIDQSVVVLGVGSASIVGTLELDSADASGLAVGTVAHGHLAKSANGGGK